MEAVEDTQAEEAAPGPVTWEIVTPGGYIVEVVADGFRWGDEQIRFWVWKENGQNDVVAVANPHDCLIVRKKG